VRAVAATRYRCTTAQEYLPATVDGCSRLPDIRGVPTVSMGGGVVLFTHDSTVTIFDDKFAQGFEDSFDDGTRRGPRRMAEALRPVSGPADITKPLPAPVNAPATDLLDTIDTSAVPTRETTGGEPIEDSLDHSGSKHHRTR